ncbi:MAG: hypothetical protein ACKOX6_15235 [Bdellovibrio sp.]
MKSMVSLLIGLCCSVSFAADNMKVRRGLDEVQAAREQTRAILKSSSSNDQRQRLRYVLDRLSNAESILQSSLNSDGGGGGHYPYPPNDDNDNTGSVELYSTDSCSSGLIGMINPRTNCSKFQGASAAWGIKVNGSCKNIQDMPAEKACQAFKDLADAPSSAIKLYSTDSCSSGLIGVLTSYSDCDSMDSGNKNVWAVEVNGRCQNISDTSSAQACRALKAAQSSNAIKIYNSDSCSGSLVAYVDSRTRCEGLRGMSDAWGIIIDGQCQNISDTDIVSACQRFKP